MALRDALHRPIISRSDAPKVLTVRDGAVTLARVLAPDGLDATGDGRSLIVGASHIATLEVVRFPPELPLSWTSIPAFGLTLPGVTVQQRIDPVPDALARRMLTQSSDAALRTLGFDADEGHTADTRATQGADEAGTLLRAIADGTDRMAMLTISITCAAPDAAACAALVQTIREQLLRAGVITRLAQFEQLAGYRASLPLGVLALDRPHDVSIAACAMGMPVAAGGIRPRTEAGLPIVWGCHRSSGVPVVFDRWQATNPHLLVVAESGSGKSYATRGLLAQELAHAEDAVLILDPKYQEYRALVTSLGGVYVTLSRTAGYHINPLALPALTPARAQAVAALEEDLLAQRIGVVKALIVRELRAQGGVVDAVGQQLIEQALAASYTASGVTTDPSTWAQPMPTFGAVQAMLEAWGTAGDATAGALARALRLFTGGLIGDLFNHQSNLPITNPLLAIDLSALLATQDETLARLIPVVVMDCFTSVAINRPTGRRYHLVLDEAHALLHTEAGARTLQLIIRVGRSLGFKATVITQSLSDLTGSPVTQTLLENTRTKLILGLNGESGAVTRAQTVLGLNDQETAYLATCRYEPGIGSSALLLADGDRVPLAIPPWPGILHQLARQ